MNKEELQVEMFVRTNYGINKIVNYSKVGGIEHTIFKDMVYVEKNRDECIGLGRICVRDIKKASFNIIDLIEPMDLLYVDVSPDDCGGIVVPRVAETEATLNEFKEAFASGYWILKGVLTKEQIQAGVYRIGE